MFGFLKSRKPEEEYPLEPESDADAQQRLTAEVEDADRRGVSSVKRVELRFELAEAQCRLGSFRDAENTLRKAVVLCAQASDARLFLNCLDAMAGVFLAMGNFAAMEEATHEAVRVSMSLPNEDGPHKEARMYRLAMAQHKNGRFAESLASFDKVIALRERTFGPNHLETGNLFAEIGRLCLDRGDHEKAQGYLRRALHIHENERGIDSEEANQDLEDLAGSLETTGDVDGAATQYERALTLKMRKLGNGNIDAVAEMQYKLANLHVGWGNLSRAQEHLESCIGTFRRSGGPRLAVAYETLAQVEEGLGRISFAVAEMEKAAKAWEKCMPPRLQELIRNLEYRADMLDQLRQRREADYLRKQAAQLLAGIEEQLGASAKTA